MNSLRCFSSLIKQSKLQMYCPRVILQTNNVNKRRSFDRWYSDVPDNLNLNIDNTAVERLKAVLQNNQFLRVLVEGGGCSGFQYKFEIDSTIDTEEDMVFEKDGIKVVSDEESVKILSGSTVEYHTDLIRAGFRVVDIPQAETGCSCGISFSIKL